MLSRSERNAQSLFALVTMAVMVLLCWLLAKWFPLGLPQTGSAVLLFFGIAFGLNGLAHYGKTVWALWAGRLRLKDLGAPTIAFLLIATAGAVCLLGGLLLWAAAPDLRSFRN